MSYEYKKVATENDINGLKEDIDNKADTIKYNNVVFNDLQKGVFQNGTLNTNGNAGISSDTLYNAKNKIFVEVEEGYCCIIFKFTSTGVYTGVYNVNTSDFSFEDSTFWYKFQFGKADESILTQEDFNKPSNFVNKHFKVYYDKDYVIYKKDLQADNIPIYWKEHLSSKETTIKSYLDGGKNVASFVFVTDLHWKTNAKNSPLLIKDIVEKCNIPFVVVGGDLVGGGSSETKETTKTELKEVNDAFSIIDAIRLTCIGNHDDNSISTKFSETLNTNEKFNHIERYTNKYLKLHYGKTGNYYYVDDELNNIRYIITDCYDIPYEDNGNDTLKYSSMTIGTYREEQIQWFINEALNVPNDSWNVVVFSHNPINQGIIENDYLLMNVLNAFNNKNVWSGSSLTSVREEFRTSVSVDFTSKGGNAIAWISGHQHVDKQVTASTTYPVIVTTCDTITTGMTEGSITEQAFDVFTINLNTKTINATRIGYGSDREFTYN